MKYITGALLAVMLTTSAHADLDAWTIKHGRQFKARWHGHAGGVQWQKEMVKFCQEGFMHDYDIGTFDAVSTAERLKNWTKIDRKGGAVMLHSRVVRQRLMRSETQTRKIK
jgi:hypothetical protein